MTIPGLRALMVAMMLALWPMAAFAQAPTHIKAQLVAESVRPRAGEAVTLAFVMTPAPGWHGYWRNGGDAGMETQLAWTLPAGASAGPLSYPTPGTLLVAGLMNHVYEARYAQLIDLNVPAGLAPGTPLPVRVKLDWLACTEEICVPETATLSLALTVGDGAVAPATRAAFDRYRAALPRPIGGTARFAVADGRFRLAVPLPATAQVETPHFFALTDGALDYAAAQTVSRAGDTLIVETRARDGAGELARIEGVLAIGPERGLEIVAVPGAVPAAGAPIKAVAAEPSGNVAGTFLAALGGAILGGLLLNVMPCVFPILSLKALSLARAGGTNGAARREAIAYTAGVVLVCVGLGALLLLLRAGGEAAGWAFQLQDSRVILLLLLLTAAIGFNLAGLFELPAVTGGDALAASGGARGAFWTGALAAFVATPCTGPFMGLALGTALLLPPAAAMAVFAGLGLGLALPFLLLGFVPALRRGLPRPGPWMARARRVLAIPMFLTAIGLAWILGRQAGVDAMTLGLVGALLVTIALWWVGRRQARGRTRAWLPLAPALAAAAALIALMPSFAPAEAAPAAAVGGAEPFSEATLDRLRAAGTPVFVYFTADWCLTCKVNERAAIDRDEVRRAFAAKGARLLVGDWTRGDAAISRFLAKHGRSGVPLYLWYAPGREAEVLPQLLTPARLTGLVGRADDGRGGRTRGES